jgi:hypothetical protein
MIAVSLRLPAIFGRIRNQPVIMPGAEGGAVG